MNKSRGKVAEIDIKSLGLLEKSDLLISLIYKTLNLDTIDLEDYLSIPFVEQLKDNKEDPVYHPEGTTMAHTQLVMEEPLNLLNEGTVNKREAEILRLAALLHDIGKPETSVSSNGRVKSRGHDLVSFQKAKYILDACQICPEIKLKVLSLIKEHMVPVAFCKQNSSSRAYQKLSWRVDTRMLYYFSMCDYKGRNLDESESLENLEKFKDDCIANGVWGETPVRYKKQSPMLATLLVGIPGSGKSSYAKNLSESYGYEIISSDEIRDELCGDAEDQSKNNLVFSTLHRRIRDCGKNMKDVIVDATNYSKRNQILRVIRESGYRVKIVYLDTPYSVCLDRNKKRSRVVPENVIKKQYELLVYPNYSEADEIEVVGIHHKYAMPSFGVSNIRELNNIPFNMSSLEDGYNLEIDGEIANIKSVNLIMESLNNLIDRNWLIHLPPTMSPCDSSEVEGYLEHPQDVFKYFTDRGQNKIIYEHKYMGSRSIIIICRNKTISKSYFGDDSKIGVIYSRKGRDFFDNDKTINTLHNLFHPMMESVGMEFIVLDAEIRPWNLKAGGLIRNQYQKSGESGEAVYSQLFKDMKKALNMSEDSMEGFKNKFSSVKEKREEISKYNEAYKFYCWDKEDIKINPFHVLAAKYNNGYIWNGFNESHESHINFINDYLVDNIVIFPVEYGVVDLNSDESKEKCIKAWKNYTERGYEGFVFKPLDYVSVYENEFIQPAVKCRGRDYLRIIYGMDYLNRLDCLRRRNTKKKRYNAIREFKIGKRALEKFLSGGEVWDFHKYVLGILSMETDPIDPRL